MGAQRVILCVAVVIACALVTVDSAPIGGAGGPAVEFSSYFGAADGDNTPVGARLLPGGDLVVAYQVKQQTVVVRLGPDGTERWTRRSDELGIRRGAEVRFAPDGAGDVWVSGQESTASAGHDLLRLVRLAPDGDIDRAISVDGIATASPVPLPDGDILLFGATHSRAFPSGIGRREPVVASSGDGGGTWVPSDRGLADAAVKALAVAPSPLRYQLACQPTLGALSRRSAQPGGWTAIAPDCVDSFVFDPANPQVVYSGRARSVDGGRYWTYLADVPGFICAVDQSIIYACGSTGGATVSTSVDGGLTWTPHLVSGEYKTGISALAISPADHSILAGLVQDYGAQGPVIGGEIFRSVDGGSTWSQVGAGTAYLSAASAIVFDPARPTVVYAQRGGIQERGHIDRSVDGGLTWETVLEADVGSLAVDAAAPGTVFAGGTGVYRSNDYGASWRRVSRRLVSSLAFDGVRGRLLAGGSAADDVFLLRLSADGSIAWSTLLGGSGADRPEDLAIGNGRIYVTGTTYSPDFPARGGARNRPGGDWDAFVASFAADGALLSATLLGGSLSDKAHGVAIARDGGVLVGGETNSPDFPVRRPLWRPAGRDVQGFVSLFRPDLGQLLFSTVLNAPGRVSDVAAVGSLVCASGTAYEGFPLVLPLQRRFGGDADAFAACLDPAARALRFSTYWGGGHIDEGNMLDADGGELLLSGETSSISLPVSPGGSRYHGGARDGFLLRVSLAGVPGVTAGK